MNTAMAIVVLLIAALTTAGSAQQVETCASTLVPCGPYINSTSPPESCCGPLKDALTNDLKCLCSIFNSPSILKAFHIDLNSALQLPKHCGMPSFSNNIACANSTAGAPGHSIVPPATPGDNSNAARSTTWFGLSGLATFILFWWSLIA